MVGPEPTLESAPSAEDARQDNDLKDQLLNFSHIAVAMKMLRCHHHPLINIQSSQNLKAAVVSKVQLAPPNPKSVLLLHLKHHHDASGNPAVLALQPCKSKAALQTPTQNCANVQLARTFSAQMQCASENPFAHLHHPEIWE